MLVMFACCIGKVGAKFCAASRRAFPANMRARLCWYAGLLRRSFLRDAAPRRSIFIQSTTQNAHIDANIYTFASEEYARTLNSAVARSVWEMIPDGGMFRARRHTIHTRRSTFICETGRVRFVCCRAGLGFYSPYRKRREFSPFKKSCFFFSSSRCSSRSRGRGQPASL